MIYKDRWKRKKILKPIEKFKRENFVYNKKHCSKCGRRKTNFHHYLCESCWKKKKEQYENTNS